MTTKTGPIDFDPETGEIISNHNDVGGAPDHLPAVRTGGADVALGYESLEALIAAYQEPEPDPREVAMWLLGGAEKTEDDAEESQISIMLRILGAEGADKILSSQEVIGAQTLLGELLTIQDVKWKKSAVAGATGVYALITAHRETTDTDVVVSCGAKNVCAQLLKLKAARLLPVKAAVTKSSKPTAAGFYPLWLEPR